MTDAPAAGPDAPETDILIPAIAEDGARYPIEKMAAHRRGVLHDAVSVFVFSGAETLLQRRALSKYHCGGLWANACCTHPFIGEGAADCARRRLKEELGLEAPLQAANVVEYRADVGGGLTEHERVAVFRAEIDRAATEIRPNPAEVAETAWTTLPALNDAVAAQPERLTPWLRIYLARWRELGLEPS